MDSYYDAEIEFALTAEDGEDNALNIGSELVSVVMSSSVSEPYIENDTLYLPESSGGSAPLAYFDSSYYSSGVSTVAGLIQGLRFESDIKNPRAYNGEIYFPMTSFPGASYASTGINGAVRSIRYTAVSEPFIDNGDIYLPLPSTSIVAPAYFAGRKEETEGIIASMYFMSGIKDIVAQAGRVALPLAYYEPYYGTSVAGGIQSVSYNSSVTEPQIIDGEMLLPVGNLKGMRTAQGNNVPWGDLGLEVGNATVLSMVNIAGETLYLTASYEDGFLHLGFNYN